MTLAPVIAVVGPSGVGKDTVMQAIAARHPHVALVRRVITRDQDAGGEDFDSVSPEAFEAMKGRSAFVLDWCAHGLQYGIPATIEDQRRTAVAVLANLSRGVLSEAQTVFPGLTVLSLHASREVLRARLAGRGREDAGDLERRLDRVGSELPDGLHRIVEVENSGPLAHTIDAAIAALQLESV